MHSIEEVFAVAIDLFSFLAAGIPDFRSPGTGLYDNLQKYDLPSPQSIFEISYFKVRLTFSFILGNVPKECKRLTITISCIKTLQFVDEMINIYWEIIYLCYCVVCAAKEINY